MYCYWVPSPYWVPVWENTSDVPTEENDVPCLQTFVVALPASGKGVLSLVRLLAEPIHDEIREQVDESMACYRREKAKYDTLGKERGKRRLP